MLRIGLTGGVATGKSHVRAQMAELGWSTIDADSDGALTGGGRGHQA